MYRSGYVILMHIRCTCNILFVLKVCSVKQIKSSLANPQISLYNTAKFKGKYYRVSEHGLAIHFMTENNYLLKFNISLLS